MRFIRTFFSLFCTYQALAIGAANFPADTALSDLVTAPFASFLTWTEQWQTWDMFDTIPYDHGFTVRAFAVDVDAKEVEIGPILPGLRPFSADLRTQTFFYRIYPGSTAAAKYWETYAERLCVAAQVGGGQSQAHERIASIYVDFVSDRTRALADIRTDGVISQESTTSRGPYQCRANAQGG